MKNWLLVLFIIVITSTSASASYLSIGFAGTSEKVVDATISGTIDINVYITMGASSSDIISGVAFGNTYDSHLTQLNSTTSLDNWSAAGVNAPFGSNQFAVGAGNAVTDSVTAAPGERILLGVQTVRYYLGVGGVAQITFDDIGPISIGSDTGLLSYNQAYGDWAGYWAYGAGDPGKSSGPNQRPADPLFLVESPEPASLTLLALGGLALIRRR